MGRRYATYSGDKESGEKWIGKVPVHWDVQRLGQYFEERREKVSDKDYPPLSVTMNGIVPQLETAAKTDAGDNRKLVLKNDFVINSRSDRKGSSGVSTLDGSVSLISIVMKPREIRPSYVHHLLRSEPFQEEFYRFGKGIVADLWSTNASEMRNIKLPIPSPHEQEQIANFLDHETAKIDTLIDKQQQLIKLLKEKRQAVISHAVTKGLNADAPMKDSGVEWLGQVPVHWDVAQLGKKIQLQRGVDITKDEQELGEIPVVSSGGISSFHSKAICDGPGVLVGRKGTAGKMHYIEIPYWPHDTTLYVREFRGNNPRFVYYKLLSMNLESFDTGSANPTLNRNVIHPEKVSWPDSSEQLQISSYLDELSTKIDALIEKSTAAISLLQERRTALISAAVTGKIDVRNWNPEHSEPHRNATA